MQTMTTGYYSLGLIVRLNSDRLLYIATLLTALGGGAWLGSLIN
ncbi:hypothetical protein [Vannielia sp.]|nr:hypothetical protein [Vannielia sp.]MDF1872659.1 hypothetical protein [Vannielia sp.]